MMAEFPTTDTEAFANTGSCLFSAESIEALRRGCRDAVTGELSGNGADLARVRCPNVMLLLHRRALLSHPAAMPAQTCAYRFTHDPAGRLKVWQMPCPEGEYIATVDIGGRTSRSDWSVIAVMRTDTPKPEIVAQWRGHTDHDLLADKAQAIGCFYNDALLAVESNSLEQSGPGQFILNRLAERYPRLYFRESGKPGFHTNTQTKGSAITALVAAVRDGSYTERCADACNEMLSFEETPEGNYSAKPGAHDDILMTRAIALAILQ